MFGRLFRAFRMEYPEEDFYFDDLEEPEKPEKPKENNRYLGYIPGTSVDFQNGRPAYKKSPTLTGSGDYINDFTNMWQDTPITESYKNSMRSLIAQQIGQPDSGGKYWNCYFHQWQQFPLSPEYHEAVHELCRGGVEV